MDLFLWALLMKRQPLAKLMWARLEVQCCSVLPCGAVWCSVVVALGQVYLGVPEGAVCCIVLQRVAVWSSVLQCAATCCSVLVVAVCCSVLLCVAVYCSVLRACMVSAISYVITFDI